MTFPMTPQQPGNSGYYQGYEYPQQPGHPQQPPQGYAQPPAQPGYPQMPPQGYGPPQGQQTQQPLAQGSLDSYFAQPSSGGGAALKFEQTGQTQVGIVARPVTNADVQQQTSPGTGQPAFYKDGRPKFVMKVPLRVEPTQAHPDGLAQWYVAGAARDELVRAMAEAGAPVGPPEAGAAIRITLTGTRPSGPGMNPAKVFQVQYARPEGAAPVEQPPVQPAPQPEVPQQQAQPPVPAEQPAAPAPDTGDGGELSEAQQKLLASLTSKQG